MAKKARNPLVKKTRSHRMKRIVYVAAEGSETEWSYLQQASLKRYLSEKGEVCLKQVKHHTGQTDPRSLLRVMKKQLKAADFQKGDEAWIVCDRDQWTDEQLREVVDWVTESASHRMALSNPKFELFLLMHFEDVKGCFDAASVDRRLKSRWRDYDKKVPSGMFDVDEIRDAVTRANSSLRMSGSIPSDGSTQMGVFMNDVFGF